jgi:hypothetical protein
LKEEVVFGPEDDCSNRFAALARMAPALQLIGGGRIALSAGLMRAMWRRRRRGR